VKCCDVMRASRDPSKLADWKSQAGRGASVGTFAEGAAYGDLVVLAVKGTAAENAILLAGPDRLAGKTAIDATNPIAEAAPVEGVLQFFTATNESLMERRQKAAPRAHFVKAFSSVGNAQFVDPQYPGWLRPTMFICGNDAQAKARVSEVLDFFGWESEDMGLAASARAIEPLCMLWCIRGFRQGEWTHAFKLLK